MATRNLIIRGGADFSGMRREMARAQQTLSNFQANASKAMGKIGAILGGLAVGKLIKDSTSMAMSVESAIGNINRNMGNNAKAFQNWVNTQAKSYGIATADAYKYGGTFSNLLASFSKDTRETTDKTTELMKATAIIASKTGRSYEDTAERIRSGMLGSTEAIEDLGVYTNVSMIESTEAFKKFANGKSWNQLSFQVQQQIRLAAILEQTYARYGNELADTTQTRHAQFIASLKNMQLSFGQAFLPIYNAVLPALTSMANALGRVINLFAQFTTALFGKASNIQAQAKATAQQAAAVTGLGKATEGAGEKAKKAGKEAKGALSGFDEINSLSQNSSGSDGSGGAEGAGAAMPAMDTGGFADSTVEVSDKIKAMADNIKAKVKEITDFITTNKDVTVSVLAGLAAAIVAFNIPVIVASISAAFAGVGTALGALLSPIGLSVAAIGILVGSFVYLYQTNEEFRNNINAVWADISNTLNGFVNNTLKPIFNYIINNFLAPIGVAFKTYILPVLDDLFVGMGNILNDILKLLQSTIDNVWGILKPAFELIKTIVIDVLEIIKGLWDKYGQDIIENVRGFIQGLQDTFQLIWDNILNPIIKPALEMLTWLWEKHLKGLVQEIGAFIMKCVNGALELYNGFIKPIIDWIVTEFGPKIANKISYIVDVFGSLLAGVSDVVKGLFKSLGGVVDFVVGVFTGNWKKAWEGVKNIFKGVFDSLVGIVKIPLNLIIDAVNKVIRGANGAKDVLNKLPGVNIGSIPTIPKLAKGGIVNSPTVAMVGEAGKEVVMPLENNTGWISELADKINSRGGNSSGPLTVILRVGKTDLARVVAEGINDISRQTGELIIDI